MTPLSIVFRVDAQDDPDARKQLADVIATARAILGALIPADAPSTGLMQVMSDDQAAQVREHGHITGYRGPVQVDPTGKPIRPHEPIPQEPGSVHVHIDPATGRRSFRPWKSGEKGMGE